MHDDQLSALASALLRVRMDRRAHFPADMFRGEQVWNLLLILFVADARGERLTGRTTIGRDGGSVETGRRWLQYLTRLGYIVGDGQGDLDDTLTVTPHGLNVLEAWLRDARADLEQIGAVRIA